MFIKFSPLILCLLLSNAVKSQPSTNGSNHTPKASQPSDQKIYINPSKPPEYMGGIVGWKKYLDKNIDISIPVTRHAPVGQYLVIVRSIISYWGSISGVIAETKNGYGLEEEAIRLVKNVPRWKPAFLCGRPVNAFMRQSVIIVVPVH